MYTKYHISISQVFLNFYGTVYSLYEPLLTYTPLDNDVSTTIYQHSGVLYNGVSNHPDYAKCGVIRIWYMCTKIICSDDKYMRNETNSIINIFFTKWVQ